MRGEICGILFANSKSGGSKMEAERRQQDLHVLLLPWLAQGHINPFFNLSKALAIHGSVRVSLLSTPINISRLRARLQAHPSPPQIELLELPLPSVHGLPPAAECTSDIQPEMADLLKDAFSQLEEALGQLMRRLSPDFVIHDVLLDWAAFVAAKEGIATLVFDVYSPAAGGFALAQIKQRGKGDKTAEDLTRSPTDYPSAVVTWRLFEARQILNYYVAGEGGSRRPIDSLWLSKQPSCGILMKSCFEEEEKYLQYQREATGKPVISVGPLMLSETGVEGVESVWGYLVEWLDKQRARSVVFVSFGSESYLSDDQIKELAFALEDTALPFLWSLRFPQSSSNWVPPSLLPEGFESRTRDRGLVVGGWVPQKSILSHASVGSYVTHGGWSSVMEAWMSELPLVVIPLKLDQGLNARQIAHELKGGIEVERDEEDGSFRKENVCKAVRMVMVHNNAEIRERLQQIRHVISANIARQQAYIEDVVNHMNNVICEWKKEKPDLVNAKLMS